MTQATAPKANWAPFVIVLVGILILALGSALREPTSPAQQHEDRIEGLREAEEFHCRMYGVPSEEAQAAGYVCP